MSEVSAAKRREEDDETEDALSWERKAGMILEVSMRNFMCHQVTSKFQIQSNSIASFFTADVHLQAKPEADLPVWRERVGEVCSPHGHCLRTGREW